MGAVQRIPPILRSCYVPVFTSECCTFCSNVQHLKLFSIGNSISSMEVHNACRSNASNTMEDRTNDVHSPKSGVILMDCKVGVEHQIAIPSAAQKTARNHIPSVAYQIATKMSSTLVWLDGHQLASLGFHHDNSGNFITVLTTTRGGSSSSHSCSSSSSSTLGRGIYLDASM